MSGTEKNVAEGVLAKIKEKKMNAKKIKILSGDFTNTGHIDSWLPI